MTGERVRLRDGSEVLVRPIAAADRERLRRAFEQLSEASRYHRFFAGKTQLTPRELTYLTEVDHRDHEALLALECEDGRAVGVARYVRSPLRPDEAEVAVTVVDEWQGRGLGTQLLERLVARARQEGIESLDALVLSDNRPMLDLLRDVGHGESDSTLAGGGTLDVHVPLQERSEARRSATRSCSKA